MQVRFVMSSQQLFMQDDGLMSSRKFYEYTIEFFDKFSNTSRMRDLLAWWDQQIFPATEIAHELIGKVVY
ncbi:hypothetical protein DXG01_016049 [Tephrocybe rancida]|nr:hypothetical protein DXG01_016049 [Tephrocybe rancida]